MRKHIFISGRVQGVGFRYFARKNADALNVKGWVKNLADGRVEAVLDGDDNAVEEMIRRCRKGPSSGRVDLVEINELSNEKNALEKFEIRR